MHGLQQAQEKARAPIQAVKMAFWLTMTMSWNGMMNHRPRLGPKANCTARTPFKKLVEAGVSKGGQPQQAQHTRFQNMPQARQRIISITWPNSW